MTKYEQYIYDLISGSSCHLSADQVYQRVRSAFPRVALATVYNNLNKLCRAGLIRKISVEGMPDRFDRMVKHDHIVCRNCGRLTDIQLQDLTASLREQLGGEFLSYDLKVFYLCPDCRKTLQERSGQDGSLKSDRQKK